MGFNSGFKGLKFTLKQLF